MGLCIVRFAPERQSDWVYGRDNQAQGAIDALRAQVALRADVRRDGAEISLPVEQFLPGDVSVLPRAILCPLTRCCFPNQFSAQPAIIET
jgi:hypothetical protein